MARLTDRDMTAIGKLVCHRPQEEGACHAMEDTQGSTRIGQGPGEGAEARALVVVSAGRKRQGRVSRFRTD
jgi:hypothetical protein